MPYAALPHGKIHYRIDGDERAPALVLCHALGTDLTLWDAQAAALSAQYRVLRYDLRGHGFSPGPDTEYTIAELAGDVFGLLDALEIAEAHVVGLSIGGLIAMALALAAPARVKQLVLANTAPRIGSRAGWEERIAQVKKEGLAGIADGAIQRWFTPEFQAREPALMARYRALVMQARPAAYAGCCAALRDADLRSEIGRISSPTFVISGRHDAVTTPAHGQEMADAVQGARHVSLAAGHLSNVEAAAAFTDALQGLFH